MVAMRIVLLTLLVVATCNATASARKPNILFILADDLGYGDLGTYPNPNTTHGHILTPNLDKLAAESLRFTDAYAGAPVCAPSRCTLMTGKHTGHCTVRSNGPILNASDVTVADVLKKAGYETALVGKWGLGGNGTVAFPTEKGFDHFYGYTSQENAHDYYPPFLWLDDKQDMIPENKNASAAKCGSPLTTHCVWAQDLFVNMTQKWLAMFAENKDKPFYLFLSFTTPHAGGIGSNGETGVPAPEEIMPYKSHTDWPQVERDFASVISLQDAQVGSVLKHLEELQLDENTVVFYASDNGAHNEGGHSYQFFDSSGPLQGFKRSLHEGGIRSPLLIRWPGVTKPGVSNQQWGFFDFLQTAAAIGGVLQEDLPSHLDGYSLVPTLMGGKQTQPVFNYFEYCHPNEDKSGWGQAVRFGDWKALSFTNGKGEIALFNLAEDIHEDHDVSSKYPEQVAMAKKIMSDSHVQGNYCEGH
eukprot:m.3398 g.3398  ORF g.3398 m.3398 type:complete len:472 (+) comp9346_c0_seq1:2159-3574(+)